MEEAEGLLVGCTNYLWKEVTIAMKWQTADSWQTDWLTVEWEWEGCSNTDWDWSMPLLLNPPPALWYWPLTDWLLACLSSFVFFHLLAAIFSFQTQKIRRGSQVECGAKCVFSLFHFSSVLWLPQAYLGTTLGTKLSILTLRKPNNKYIFWIYDSRGFIVSKNLLKLMSSSKDNFFQ